MYPLISIALVLLPFLVTAILVILWAMTKKEIYTRILILFWLGIVLILVLFHT